jgi:hypothetical protein
MRFVFCVVALIVSATFSADLAAIGVQALQQPDSSTMNVLYWVGLGTGVAVFGATLSTNTLTLADHAKRLDPTGKIAAIVEMLAQTNEILLDMSWIQGNLPTGHRTTVRTGLPTVAWRLINSGVTPSKSTTAQIDEQAGILEAWSEVDVDLVTLNGNQAATRMSEARAFIEAMNQEMASTLFYGNVGLAPEEFTGLAPRYSSLSAGNATNIIDAGGTGSDNTSLWLVSWHPDTIAGIFPNGSSAGLIHNDYGEQTIQVTAGVAGQRMRAFQERWQWKAGLALKDWRHVVRIANIDVSDLAGGSAADLVEAMETAEEIIPNELGRKVWYGNRTVFRYLRKQVREGVSAGGGITYENIGGKRVRMFGETIVRRVDAILNTEARVV